MAATITAIATQEEAVLLEEFGDLLYGPADEWRETALFTVHVGFPFFEEVVGIVGCDFNPRGELSLESLC